MFDEIDAAFKVRDVPGVMFAWGDKIFVPDGSHVPPSLLAHESVHGERQGSDVEGWWGRYLTDPEFRLAEELPAHRAEYRSICDQLRDRNERAKHLNAIARRLSSPLYGSLIGLREARSRIA